MQGMARLTGQTAGSVIMVLLFTLAPSDVAPRAGLAVGAVLAAMAAVVSLLRLRRDMPADVWPAKRRLGA
jgi:DHA2 family multidrug resistance protein-like MFS transporter